MATSQKLVWSLTRRHTTQQSYLDGAQAPVGVSCSEPMAVVTAGSGDLEQVAPNRDSQEQVAPNRDSREQVAPNKDSLEQVALNRDSQEHVVTK